MREAQQAEVLRDMSCNVMSHRGEIENDDLEEVPGSFIQEGETRQIGGCKIVLLISANSRG